jgi:hypothetical protein
MRGGLIMGERNGGGIGRLIEADEKVKLYHMITHLLTWGSTLLDGERFSISARHNSNTFPTLELVLALVSTHAALFVFANSSPSVGPTCLLIRAD